MTDAAPLPEKPEVAVGAVVFVDHRVLLVKRSKPPSEGLWAIPGGRVNIGETLQKAARREVAEETGIEIRAGDVVYTFDVIEHDPEGRVRFHYVVVDLRADYIGGDLMPGDDADDARWVSEKELLQLNVSLPTKRLPREAFRFGG